MSSVFPAQVAPPTKVDHSTVGTLRPPQVKYHVTITKKSSLLIFLPEMNRNHPSTHLTLLAQGKKHLVPSRCTTALNVLNVITAVLLIRFYNIDSLYYDSYDTIRYNTQLSTCSKDKCTAGSRFPNRTPLDPLRYLQLPFHCTRSVLLQQRLHR